MLIAATYSQIEGGGLEMKKARHDGRAEVLKTSFTERTACLP
jgi:hypothetical protein